MSSVLRRGFRVLMAPSPIRPGSVSAAEKPKPKRDSQSYAGRATGLQKMVQVSPRLASFLGVTQSSRANAMKSVWAHIKHHNLQSPSDKRVVNCDAKLRLLFEGRDKVDFLEVAKFLSPHFAKTS